MNLKYQQTILLNEQTNYKLIEIGKIKHYFDQETKEQQILIKKLGKYITGFDYADKILTVFLTVFSGTNIFAQAKEKEKIVRIGHFCFSFIFLFKCWNNKKIII